MQHFIQAAILSAILSWGVSELIKIPGEVMEIMGIKIEWRKLQKRKNLAPSLATQRDPFTTLSRTSRIS